MKAKSKSLIISVLAFVLTTIVFVNYIGKNLNENSETTTEFIELETQITQSTDQMTSMDVNDKVENELIAEINSYDMWYLTDEKIVITYLKKHQRLPDYYITKGEARKLGWVARDGNLCEVLPGKAIGGDRFGNREGKLPKKSGRQYFEADLNYNCGRRNTDRVVYSNDGIINHTKDHYKNIQKQ